ncbi:MAG TPA: C39 family peptidase [Bacteroidota bacterium]|nr:C39 family peptidase [Bacteroidota bacterium]
MIVRTLSALVTLYVLFVLSASAQSHPDQHYVLRIDSLIQRIETNDGLELSSDGKRLQLQPGRTDGSVIFTPQYAQHPFNHGLPSWNGSAPDYSSSFKIQMRFPSGTGWSPWLTVGFWNANIWSSYGTTSYSGGYIDYDYVKLGAYAGAWQFKVIMTRASAGLPSPTLHKLSFFVSDTATTTTLNFSQILADRPAQILIPTTFVYQYGVDPDIGGSICSPTSVSMILLSYNITVNPLTFAQATRDPYYRIFGIWPRVVQNAAGYGLDGAVTRYRTWSQARDVLARGGRIAMSVGEPLYSGHLMMLAGFAANGDPIVHDPARSNGYSYVFNKSDLSHSWFDKGGVAYTFYPAETTTSVVEEPPFSGTIAQGFRLYQNYPNPFNPSTTIAYSIAQQSAVRASVYAVTGELVQVLVDEEQVPGRHTMIWNGTNASGVAVGSGMYVCQLQIGGVRQAIRMILMK